MTNNARAAEDRVRVARIVAEHWRSAAMEWGDRTFPGRVTAHPLCLVLAALDGETDPVQLGIGPRTSDGRAIRAAATRVDEAGRSADAETVVDGPLDQAESETVNGER